MDDYTRRMVSRRAFLRGAAVVGLGTLGGGLLAACAGSSSSGSATASVAASIQESAAATAAASAAASLATSSTPDLSGVTLNVLCWEGYTDDSFVKPFEQATGAKIQSTFIGSNDELVAKLRGGGASLYDLTTPSSDTDRIIIDAGLAMPLDPSAIPNWQTAYPAFKTAEAVNKDGQLYGVPMCWGVIPLLVDLDKVPSPANSWSILWDPQYKGKISVWNDISTIYNTGFLLGFKDVYNLTDDQLSQIKRKLIEQKPLVRKYWSTAGELTNLFAAGEVVVANSFGGLTYTQLTGQGKHMREYVPQEGASAWVDYWLVSKGTRNPAAAFAWLNYIHEAKTQALIYKATGYGPTNQDVVSELDASVVKTFHLDEPTYMSGLSYWQAVPRRSTYLDILNSVLSA